MIRDHPIRGEGQRDFLGESEDSPSPLPQDSYPDACEAINDFWSMSGNFIYRHHVEPRVKLYSPREESFPVPLKNIDVSRTTQTNLDVMWREHDARAYELSKVVTGPRVVAVTDCEFLGQDTDVATVGESSTSQTSSTYPAP